jgi:DNA-binding NarL/FixJ family response regulator
VADIYLVYQNRLFGDAIRAILDTHPEIKLLGVTNCPDRAANDIARLAPNVILMEDAEDGPPIHDVHRILTSSIPCRLITLRLDEGGMHIWSQTWRQTAGPQDLVDAIVSAKEDKL